MSFHRYVFLCTSFVLLGVLLTGCSKRIENGASSKAESISSLPVSVRVHVIEPKTFKQSIQLSAELMPISDLTLSALSGGNVESMRFDVGDRVSKGTILAEIGATVAHAQYKSALSQYRASNGTYGRMKSLHEKQLISAQEFEMTQAQRDLAFANLNAAKVGLNNAVLRSPLNGFIAEKFTKSGEMIVPGAPIYNVVDISSLEVIIGLNGEDVYHVNSRTPVRIYLSSLDKWVTGRVTQVGLKAVGPSRTFPVKIRIPNPQAGIKPGLIGDVYLTLQQVPNVVVIRQDHILERGDQKQVFVEQAGKAELRLLKVRPSSDNNVMVESGLKPGDRLIVEGVNQLSAGRAVSVIQ